jgi:glycosyltransferase involved in cell wall biosynthesis
MTRVLLISHELIGRKMAGPGIRYASLARVLAAHMDVTLAAPVGSGATTDAAYALATYARGDWPTLAPALADADVVIMPPDAAHEFPQIAQSGVPIAVDGYNPLIAEWLSTHGDVGGWRRRLEQLKAQYHVGDFFFCASERQRDWWLGLLEAHGRINPLTIADDPSLRRLIDVVPYGLTPSDSSRAHAPIIKGVWPGIAHGDRVVLWGGGLWPWLDPFTAIRAIALLVDLKPGVRLVFPGTRHPNPELANLRTHLDSARELARSLGLIDRHVFFGDWVPYERWPDVLHESDVALSLHHDTFETRLAFRSRILEYLGAGVPVVATRGDATSELIGRFHMGETVAESDSAATAEAIARLLQTPRKTFEPGRASLLHTHSWEQVALPLIRYCHTPWRAADRGMLSTRATHKAELTAENARLRALVHAYEQGRFMRLMRWVKLRLNRSSDTP